MAEELLASLEALSRSYAQAEAQCLLPLSDGLDDLKAFALRPDGARELEAALAVPRLLATLPSLASHCPELHGFGSALSAAHIPSTSEPGPASSVTLLNGAAIRPLVRVLRVIQVLLVKSPSSRDALLSEGGVDMLATLVDRILAAAIASLHVPPGSEGTEPKPAQFQSLSATHQSSSAIKPGAALTRSRECNNGGRSPAPRPARSRSISRSNATGLTIQLDRPAASPSGGGSPAMASPGQAHVAGQKSFGRYPPPSPSVLSLPRQVLLDPDHAAAVAKIFQVLGNFCAGGEKYQQATWDRCFPGTFARAAAAQDWQVLSPLAMVLFTCARNSATMVSQLTSSPDGLSLLSSLLRAEEPKALAETLVFPAPIGPQEPETGMDEWLSLLLHLVCVASASFPEVYTGIIKHPPRGPPEMLRPVACEQAALLWTLWGTLHDEAYRRGPRPEGMPPDAQSSSINAHTVETHWPDLSSQKKTHQTLGQDAKSLSLLVNIFRETAKACCQQEQWADKRGDEDPAVEASAFSLAGRLQRVSPRALQFVLQILRISASEDWLCHPATPLAQGEALKQLWSEEVIPLTLEALGALPPPRRARPKGTSADGEHGAGDAPSGSSQDLPRKEPYGGYRRDLVGMVGNACHRHRANQDAVRKSGGLMLILQQCVLDEDNPLLKEWGLWAVRNLTEGNEENQHQVAELQIVGGAESEELRDMGLQVVVDERTKKATLQNVPASRT